MTLKELDDKAVEIGVELESKIKEFGLDCLTLFDSDNFLLVDIETELIVLNINTKGMTYNIITEELATKIKNKWLELVGWKNYSSYYSY